MTQAKNVLLALSKNKAIAAISVIASLVIPIKIFLDVVPMPATKTDIHRIEKTQSEIVTRVDTVTQAQIQTMLSEIDSLERNREIYTLQRLQIEKQLDEAVISKRNQADMDVYLKGLSQIDKNIRNVDQRLTDLREQVKKVETTFF